MVDRKVNFAKTDWLTKRTGNNSCASGHFNGEQIISSTNHNRYFKFTLHDKDNNLTCAGLSDSLAECPPLPLLPLSIFEAEIETDKEFSLEKHHKSESHRQHFIHYSIIGALYRVVKKHSCQVPGMAG